MWLVYVLCSTAQLAAWCSFHPQCHPSCPDCPELSAQFWDWNPALSLFCCLTHLIKKDLQPTSTRQKSVGKESPGLRPFSSSFVREKWGAMVRPSISQTPTARNKVTVPQREQQVPASPPPLAHFALREAPSARFPAPHSHLPELEDAGLLFFCPLVGRACTLGAWGRERTASS